jgi:hypothetical protein
MLNTNFGEFYELHEFFLTLFLSKIKAVRFIKLISKFV